jgi:hypothetical protein
MTDAFPLMSGRFYTYWSDTHSFYDGFLTEFG